MTIASTPAADFAAPSSGKSPIALWRLYLLRASFLLIVVGMGMQMWSTYTEPHKLWTLTHGVMNAMLLALVLLSVLGLRYPLKMLPVMFWEITWKTIWLLTIALPAWRGGTTTADISDTTVACSMIGILLFTVPWHYVWRNYVTARSERLI